MRDVSGVTGAAPVWKDIMDYLHGNQQSRPRRAPQRLVETQVSFVPEVEPARREWFLQGTEAAVIRLAAYEKDKRDLLPKILYPGDGTLIAVDPDIPRDHQRIQFSARSGEDVTWILDGAAAGTGAVAWWSPQAGHHVLVLSDAQGRQVDKVSFEVRGELEHQAGGG
jgi:penicillin-binding protein 1C